MEQLLFVVTRKICCYVLECVMYCLLLLETFVVMYWNVAGTVYWYQKHLLFCTGM
jgi:hypothetical protein